MRNLSILFADNAPGFLKVRKEFLEKEGYRVVTAEDPESAKNILEQGNVDLAILDIRLRDDEDDQDFSGLDLAKTCARPIPKIMLTGFPLWELVREALGPDLEGLSPAAKFIAKEEGPEAMLKTVRQVCDDFLRINFQLRVEFHTPMSFYDIVNKIIKVDQTEERIDQMAWELEKLIRQLFFGHSRVLLTVVDLPRTGEAIIRVNGSIELREDQPKIIKLGMVETIAKEVETYNNYPDIVKDWGLKQEASLSTVHFGAILFAPQPGERLDNYTWFAEFFHGKGTNEVCSVTNNLFTKAIGLLYRFPCQSLSDTSVRDAYKDLLFVSEANWSEDEFREAIWKLAEDSRFLSLAIINILEESSTINFHFDSNEVFQGPDPTLYLFRDRLILSPPVYQRLTLGKMDGFNVLVDQENRTWLTDFSCISPAPALYDFVALESKIRFEWTEFPNLLEAYQFESLIVETEEISLPEETQIFDDLKTQKAFNVIKTLRQLAFKVPGADPVDYQVGILFQCAKLILENGEHGRKLHALLAATMICKMFEEDFFNNPTA